jgi:DNA-binding NarL/FixJ family response regulator
MEQLQAVILHRHVLFRDLIELELRDLGPTEIVGSTNDPEDAVSMVLRRRAGALIVESSAGFLDRHEVLQLFARAAESIGGFKLICANLATSEVEVIQDTFLRHAHLGGLKPLLHGATA